MGGTFGSCVRHLFEERPTIKEAHQGEWVGCLFKVYICVDFDHDVLWRLTLKKKQRTKG